MYCRQSGLSAANDGLISGKQETLGEGTLFLCTAGSRGTSFVPCIRLALDETKEELA